MRKWFLNFQPALLNRKNLTFLLASLKTLTNSKDCSESCIKFLFRLSFSLINRFFFLCTLYIHGPFSERFSEITGGFRNGFQRHRRHSESRNKLYEEGYCMEGFLLKYPNQKLYFGFSTRNEVKMCENHTKRTILNLQKIIRLVTLAL